MRFGLVVLTFCIWCRDGAMCAYVLYELDKGRRGGARDPTLDQSAGNGDYVCHHARDSMLDVQTNRKCGALRVVHF